MRISDWSSDVCSSDLMILTGRPVAADEAHRIGLADRVVADGTALAAAVELAKQIAAFPQICMNSDRLSAYRQWDFDIEDALAHEAHAGAAPLHEGPAELGRAPGRDRVCQYVSISAVAVSEKRQNEQERIRQLNIRRCT